jgi:hypothetical protein
MSEEKETRPITLEMIEEHLKNQDKENRHYTRVGGWIALIFLGFAITISGIIEAFKYTGLTQIIYGIVLTLLGVIMTIIERK